MATNIDTSATARRPKLTTEEFAAQIRVDPQAVRAGYSRNGHYQNLIPLKLPHGQLLWNADEVEALLSGEFSPPPASPDAEYLGRECGAVLLDRIKACSSQTQAIPIISDFLVALGEERSARFRRGAACGAAAILANVLLAGLTVEQEGATPSTQPQENHND